MATLHVTKTTQSERVSCEDSVEAVHKNIAYRSTGHVITDRSDRHKQSNNNQNSDCGKTDRRRCDAVPALILLDRRATAQNTQPNRIECNRSKQTGAPFFFIPAFGADFGVAENPIDIGRVTFALALPLREQVTRCRRMVISGTRKAERIAALTHHPFGVGELGGGRELDGPVAARRRAAPNRGVVRLQERSENPIFECVGFGG